MKPEVATWDANDVLDLRGCRSPHTMRLCCKSVWSLVWSPLAQDKSGSDVPTLLICPLSHCWEFSVPLSWQDQVKTVENWMQLYSKFPPVQGSHPYTSWLECLTSAACNLNRCDKDTVNSSAKYALDQCVIESLFILEKHYVSKKLSPYLSNIC